jgi:hypothetical protein
MHAATQHTPTQHASTQHAGSTAAARPRSRSGGRRRNLQRATAVGAFAVAFAFAGQSVAQADDDWDGAWSWGGYEQTWWSDELAPGPEPAAAPAPAPAPAPEPAPEPAPAPAPAPSDASSKQAYKDYALQQLGGDATQMSCLDQLWEAESGWDPNAQNPTSTAYGIPQFLDSTWASTGIEKTSDPYRQIDAGLIYIKNRYGTPCEAWSFHQENNWY